MFGNISVLVPILKTNLTFFLSSKVEEVMNKKYGYMSYTLSKNSPYRKFMNRVLVKMFGSGQYQRLMNRWKDKKPSCTPLVRKGNPLSFEKLVSLFLILVIGVICSLIVMIYEKCTFSKEEKANLISEREASKKRCGIIFKEMKDCLGKREWPDPELIRLFNEASEKIKTFGKV